MDNASQPLISVIMPVYNSEKYLQEAVESILGQTLADFELIAIDDGSTDESAAVLESFRQADKRVIVLLHSQNQGIIAALNNALPLARGKYITRMDADDISLPERFEKQASFLEEHPGIDVVGSAAQMVDERGKNIGILSAPLDDLAIHWASIFSSPFIQATAMFRHSVINENGLQYRGTMEQSYDFDFSIRLLEHAHAINFAEPLYIYRIHSASVTSYFKNNADRKSGVILTNIQKRFPGLAISYEQVRQVSGALRGKPSMRWKRAEAADTYLRVWQTFSESHSSDPGFRSLQTNVALIAAKLTLYPPLQLGWRKALRHIFEIEPHWYVAFVRKFPEMVSTKIHSQLIQQNRK